MLEKGMAELPLSTVAGQVLVAGFDGTEPPVELLAAAQREHVAGFILFRRNLGEVSEVAELNARLAGLLHPERPALVGVDQEGGRVARLGPPVLPLPPMRALGDRDDPDLTREAGFVLGRQLRALGFTMDFAPVLDVDTNPDNPVIGDRAFGREPERVVRHALAFADGLATGGVLPCGKHFPGHGDTDLDSHRALPRLAHDRARLDRIELAPFRAATRARLPAIMTAHVLFDALDADVPATLSRRVVHDLLRREVGFDGVVISDDLEMRAVADRWPVPEAAVGAVDAGCDMVLICSEVEACLEAHEAIVRRAEKDRRFANRLREQALRSIALRSGHPPRPVTDPRALDAALCSDRAAAVQTRLHAPG
ncbi:MAG: beta-N-acetylhexosaminidase, partial [Myxococcota bacterium]